MSNNSFFKPTPLYKGFMILDLIEKNKNITQREISIAIGSAVSMVNNFLDEYEQKGYIKRKYLSTKTVEYFVTKKGLERMKLLNINYLHNSQQLYDRAKNNINIFLEELQIRGIKNLVFYGAGDVTTIILNVIESKNLKSKFNISIVDDNPKIFGTKIFGIEIFNIDFLLKINFDGIFIGSYTYRDAMVSKIKNLGIQEEKIIKYFE